MKLTRYDRILIFGLIAVALLCLLIIRCMATRADAVIVSINGREAIRSPLIQNRHFSVHGQLGEAEIEIKDGRVRMVNSPCPKKECVQTGWIDKPYQAIICLPGRIVIRLTSGNDEIDGITE